MARKAIFLDRDGTLNVDPGYVHKLEDLVLYDDVPEALRLLQSKGYLLIVITNQSGVGRGKFMAEALEVFHQALRKTLKGKGVTLDAIYVCPHLPEENCPCRKPNTLLAEQAIEDFDIAPSQSYFVGDRDSDMECGRQLGIRTFLVTHEPGGTLLEFAQTL